MIGMVGLVLDGGGHVRAATRAAERRGHGRGRRGQRIHERLGLRRREDDCCAGRRRRGGSAATGTSMGVGGMSVGTSVTLLSAGARVRVEITKPHVNDFAGVMGMATWDVSVEATAMAGLVRPRRRRPVDDEHQGLQRDGTPKYTSANPQNFGESNGDYSTERVLTSRGPTSTATTTSTPARSAASSTAPTSSWRRSTSSSTSASTTRATTRRCTATSSSTSPGTSSRCRSSARAPRTAHHRSRPPGRLLPGLGAVLRDQRIRWAATRIRGYFLSDFKSVPLTVGECTAQQQAGGSCG